MNETPTDTRWVQRLWPAATYQFAFVAAVAILKSASNAVVLARFQASALPYLYLVAAGLTATFSMAQAFRPRGRRRDPILLALLGTVLASGGAVALWMQWSSAALFLYLFAETFATYVAIGFWATLADAFDPREARRAFPAVSGIGMGGGIVGGFLAQLLATHAGTNWLLLAAAGFLGIAAFVFRFHRVPEGIESRSTSSARVDRSEAFVFAARSSYVQVFALLVLAFSVNTAFVDFVFRQRAAQAMNEDALAALFGNQQLFIGLFCMVFQLFLAERLLKQLGILKYLALVPFMMAPLAGIALVNADVWPVYLLKLVEAAASLSILPVGVQLLYAPMPDGVRDSLRSTIDGLLRKGGVAIGGLLLIGVGSFLIGPTVTIAVIGLCALAGFLLLKLQPLYVAILQERMNASDEEEISSDGDDAKLLLSALTSEEPDRVLHAVTLLQHAEVDLRPHLPVLLGHANERVLERGVQLALELQAAETVPTLEKLVDGNARRPRDEAVWALAALSPEVAGRSLPRLMDSPDVGLRCAAIGALIGTQGGFAAQGALQALAAKGELAPLAERREVARLLGRLHDERWAPFLGRYLKDGDASVRRIAIRAVGEGRYESLAAKLLPFLTWREERRNAREALALFGDVVTPLIEEAMNDRTRSGSLRYELPRVLRQIGTQKAFDALLFSNIDDDAFLHYRIGVSLTRMHEENPKLLVDTKRVREAIERRRRVYQQFLEPYRDLRAGLGDTALLTRAVGDRLDQAFELTFWLHGLLYGARALRRVHEQVAGKDARRRAYALELLENLMDQDDLDLLRKQLEEHHRDLPPGDPERLEQHFGMLCHSNDDVLRATARQTARTRGLWSLPPMEDDMSEELVKKLFALEGVEIFAQSDVDDLTAVAHLTREVKFQKGEQIWHEGDPGDALYVIVQGRVSALRAGEVVLTMKEKEVIGDVSLLDGSPRPTDMIADEDTRALMIDRRDFMDLISDRPELLKGVFRAVSQQLKKVVDLVERKSTGEIPKVVVAGEK